MSSNPIGKNKEVNLFKSSSPYDATHDPKKPEASESQYLTSEVNERLCAICPAPKRCMVTLESAENNPIEICHILAHQTEGGYLERLKQHWGMKNSLDINIPENLTFMRVDMHRSFDRGDWALFPELDLLWKISLAYTNNEGRVSREESPIDLFRKFQGRRKGKPHKYRLVWLDDINASTNLPIMRRRLPPAINQGMTPYANFPLIESHVHPLLIIYNAGEKLSGRTCLTNLHGGMRVNLAAPVIACLYKLWSKELQLGDKPHDNGDEDDGGEGGDDCNDGEGDVNDSEDDDDDSEDDGNDDEDDTTGSEDGGREDNRDDNASDENVDDHDGHGEGHDGHSPKAREHTETHGKPQGIQNAAALPRNRSTHFDTSTVTPELVGNDSMQGSVKPACIQGEDARHDSETSDYGDLDGWIAEWAANAEAESNIKFLINDHQLKGYRKEPARQPPFEQWQHWAHSPPEVPHVIHDHDDTSHYTSYLWSLYHHDVNLLAPDGCPYRIPKPWNRHLRS